MWVPAPDDRDISWDQANTYAQNLRAGGFSNSLPLSFATHNAKKTGKESYMTIGLI
jgi:hypothetical protein